MVRERPLALRLVAWVLWFLTAWGVLAILIVARGGSRLDLVVRWILLTVLAGVAGWCLFKGIAWGFVLGIAVGFYWLYEGIALNLIAGTSDLTIAVASFVNGAIGSFVLIGLLMPSSRKWLGTAWRARQSAAVLR
jgi:hypothetical protein